ncbi:MAG: NHL repeat-containing protein [Planctomycetes bacterium]|nr:NHL repeat-containing protein [Planctomycetota bacterium]
MPASASSLLVVLALLAQDAAPPKGAKALAAEVYPWEVVPQDALWGHLTDGNFREPIGVFFEPTAKELYVADSKNSRVGIFDVEGTPVFSFGGAAVLLEPKSVLASQDGTILVLDADRSKLRRFNYRGEPEGFVEFRVSAKEGEAPRLVTLSAVTRDTKGRWYVADRELGRAWILDAEGKTVLELEPPIGKEHFESISDIAVSRDGLVAISDQRGEPVVHVYDANGKMIAAFGEHDIGLDNFTAAIALEFDENGFLFIVDLLRHDVKVFMPAGKMLSRFGGWFTPETRGHAPGELLYPTDIAIAPDGPIWVAERYGQRVQVFLRKPLAERQRRAPQTPVNR